MLADERIVTLVASRLTEFNPIPTSHVSNLIPKRSKTLRTAFGKRGNSHRSVSVGRKNNRFG